MRTRRSGAFAAIVFALAAAAAWGRAGTAHAILAAVSTDPATGAVLTHPSNGYPVWYQDTAGVALEQCRFGVPPPPPELDDAFCIPGGAATGFVNFEEAFYWAAEALMPAPAGPGVDSAILVLAIEAAFGTGNPVLGQQVVFGRIRMRADVTVPGTYTITHPYGVNVFDVAAVGPGNEINDTVDIGLAPLNFTEVLGTGIGPFLQCVGAPFTNPANPDPLARYLGNFGVPCLVTGSPNGTNVFSITGPLGTVTQDLFTVSGRIFSGVLPLPCTVDRTTYRCPPGNGACAADIFVHSTAAATLAVAAAGAIPATPLASDGAGAFFASVPVPRAALPLNVDTLNPNLQVAVTASNPPNFTPVTITRPLTDLVDVSQATFNMSTGILTVLATSSDVRATLTEGQFGPLFNGALRFDVNGFDLPITPPAQVNVVSNAGGSVEKFVSLISVPEVLRLTGATWSARRRRFAVTGTSTALGATVALSVGGAQVGFGLVDAKGRFRIVAKGPRARRVTVISSGGKSARRLVSSAP